MRTKDMPETPEGAGGMKATNTMDATAATDTSQQNHEQLSFVIVGHVDHGKSTVIGRLLADTGSLPDGKVESVRAYCARNSRPFEYAYLLDTLKDEQAQGITIDTTRIFFRTRKRRYMILDAPGHIEFLKNMVTGAAKASAALLVIDAKEGIRENSRRHGLLLSLLGIRQVVVLVNKLDLVGYSKETFEAIQTEYAAFLDGLGVKPMAFIPLSAFHGENLCERSDRMAWYGGPTVLEAIDGFEAAKPVEGQALRMPVQDVYKFTRGGDDRRIVAGTIESGAIRAGDPIVFLPSGKKSRVKSIEAFGGPRPEKAVAGEATGFCLEEQVYIPRGELACREGDAAPDVSTRFRATVFWLGKEELAKGRKYLLKLGTQRCEAWLHEVSKVVDTSALAEVKRDRIATNEVAECVFDLERPIAFETYSRHDTLSRFVLFDGFEMSGGGVIRESLPGAEETRRQVRESVQRRELKWERGLVAPAERQARTGHPAALVLVTGPRQAPRKEIAKALERELFRQGHSTYFLGFGNLLYGVGASMQDAAPLAGAEQVRKLAEIAHLWLDAGMLLVVSAHELNAEDVEIIRMSVGGAPVRVAWVGDEASAEAAGVKADILVGASVEEACKRIGADLKAQRLTRHKA